MEFITALKDTPLPTILVIGGIFFLFLGIATIKKPIVIDITPPSRKIALVVGILLVAGGVYLMVQPTTENSAEETATLTSPMATETLVSSNTVENNPPTPLFVPTEEDLSIYLKNLVITEVLGNPCGADSRNEFVEIYNSGDREVDILGLWLTDGEEADKIISWGERFPSVNLGAVMTTTLIPPRGFAIILAPGYPFVNSGRIMPYRFPPATIILTVADGQLLGDEKNGIEVTNRDPIILYQGDKNNMHTLITLHI